MPKLSEITLQIKVDALQYREGLKAAALESKLRVQQMREDLMKLKTVHDDVGKSSDTMAGKIKGLGLGVIGNIARFTSYYLAVGAVKNAIGGAISEFRNLDEQLHNVQSITLQSDDAIKETAKSLLGMVLSGDSAGQSAGDLAEALYEVVSSGYEGADALQVVELAAKGASAGLSTTKETADALMTILQSYKMPVSEAAGVMDQLFTIVDLGRIHFSELNTGMGYLIPTAAALNIPLDEVGAAIELLTRQGQMPSRVMTNLNDVLTRLLKPNEKLTAAIHELGYESGATMVKQIGLVSTIEKLSQLAEKGGVSTGASAEDIKKFGDAAKQADQALTDQNETMRRAKVTMDAADAALRKLKTSDSGYAAALERSKRAHFDYEKSVRETSDAQQKSKDAHEKAADAINDVGGATEDADSLLTQWVGDVRAIRALLPLAANEGRDYTQMLVEHRKEIAEGGRMEKALVEQQKSFNYQLRALSANFKAVAAVIVGPVVQAFTGLMRGINDLFKKIVEFDPITKKAVFIWEKFPKIIDYAKIALAGLGAIIATWLIPIILGLIGTLAALAIAFLTNPMTWVFLAIAGIVMILQATGKLDDAWRLLKDNAIKAFGMIKGAVQDLAHFFKLGLGGGGIGGDHSPFEKIAFGIGQAVRDAIPHIKDFLNLMQELAHLFLLGFQGGSIGGEFSGLEKAAFKAGQIIKDIWNFLKNTAVPAGISILKAAIEVIHKVLAAVKGMIDDLSHSESLLAFLGFMADAFHWVYKAIGDVIDAIGRFVQTPLGKTLLEIGKYIAIAAAAVAFFSTGIGEVVLVVGLVVSAIYILFNVIDYLVKVFHTCMGAVQDVQTTLNNFASSILVTFSNILSSLGEFFSGIIDTILATPAKIMEAAEGMFNAGKNFMQRFFDGAGDVIQSAISGGSGIASKIVSAIKRHIMRPAMAAIDEAIPNSLDLGIASVGLPDNPIRDLIHYDAWAKGVRDWMGGLALLGENGPEFAFLPHGTSVATAPKTSRIMDNMASGGAGGGATVNAQFNVTAPDIDSIIRQLHGKVDELDRQMRFRAVRAGTALNGRLS